MNDASVQWHIFAHHCATSENVVLPRSDGLGRQGGVTLTGAIIGVLCTMGRTYPALYIRTPLSIGPGLCELPRIPIPRTPVNKGKRKGRSPVGLAPYHSLLVPFSGGRRGLAPSLQCTRRRTQAGLLRRPAGWTHKMSPIRRGTLTASLP